VAKRRAKCPDCGHHFEIDPSVDVHVLCPSCGRGLALPPSVTGAAGPPSLVGQKLGDYEVIELLGRGGMGAVYKARQLSLDRPVALKVLDVAISADASFIERFTREARAAAAVSHPNIIEVYAIGQDGGREFIAMEFVDGESVGDRLARQGRLPADEVLSVVKQVASALARAHAAGIFHRDIKPANILMASDGRAKVADFGVAKHGIDGPDDGQVVGTALFMAPEVAIGQPADARSDLYSLGITAYAMLAGKPPFEGRTATELAIKHAQSQPTPLSQLVPDAPAGLSRVVHQLIRKHPDERYQSATDLLAALDRADAAPAARPQTAARPRTAAGTRPVRSRAGGRLPLIAGAAAGVLALAVLAVVIFASRGPGTGGRVVGVATHVPPPPTKTDGAVPPPPPPPAEPPWAEALAEAEAKAKALAASERFAEALAAYGPLLDRYKDDLLAKYVNESLGRLRRDADAACSRHERRARTLTARNQFDEARAALAPVLEGYGVAELKQRVASLVAEIGEAETRRKEAMAQAEAEAARKAALAAEREKQRLAELALARALEPIDRLIGQWQFQAALDALGTLAVEHESLQPRLETRRDQLTHLHKLKAAIMARINAANPRLSKRDLLIPGINGEVTRADEKAVYTILPNAQTETHPWSGLSSRCLAKLLELVIRPDQADDCLAAGLLAMAAGSPDDAEAHFAKARQLGADVERFRDPLAAAAFVQANTLIEGKRYDDAVAALDALEKRFADTPWLAAHRDDLADARTRIKTAQREARAEKLYAAAAAFFQADQLFELKPLIDQLQKDFAGTQPVADANRKPSVAQMAEAVAKLADVVTVSKDGTGQHLTVQKAIDAAKPGATIVILDSSIYGERLLIPAAKKGLRIQGKRGAWPILSSRLEMERRIYRLVDVSAPDVVLEGLVISVHEYGGGGGNSLECIHVDDKPITVRSCVLYAEGSSGRSIYNYRGRTTIDHCVLFAQGDFRGPVEAANSIWLHYYLNPGGSSMGNPRSAFTNCVLHKVYTYVPCTFQQCTITGLLDLNRSPNTVKDSIAFRIDTNEPGTTIDYCDVFGRPGYADFAAPGPHCFTANPQFIDMDGFDFRLKSTSPCRGKASDGGDVGCRFTPQMRDLLKLAHDLRRRGIIKFTPFGSWSREWLD